MRRYVGNEAVNRRHLSISAEWIFPIPSEVVDLFTARRARLKKHTHKPPPRKETLCLLRPWALVSKINGKCSIKDDWCMSLAAARLESSSSDGRKYSSTLMFDNTQISFTFSSFIFQTWLSLYIYVCVSACGCMCVCDLSPSGVSVMRLQ